MFEDKKLDYVRMGMFARLADGDTYGGHNHPYSELFWPIGIPLVHAYNPSSDGGMRKGVRFLPLGEASPEFTLTVKSQSGMDVGKIPSDEIQAALRGRGISQVMCSIVVQNNPWVEGTNILFRPQPWVHQEAKHDGNATFGSEITTYWAPVNNAFVCLGQGGVTTHPQDSAHGQHQMIFSGPDFPSLGKLDPGQTHMFYTVCIDEAKKQAALTLHIVCNDDDHDNIKRLVAKTNPQGMQLQKDVTTLAAFTEGLFDQGMVDVGARMTSFVNGDLVFADVGGPALEV